MNFSRNHPFPSAGKMISRPPGSSPRKRKIRATSRTTGVARCGSLKCLSCESCRAEMQLENERYPPKRVLAKKSKLPRFLLSPKSFSRFQSFVFANLCVTFVVFLVLAVVEVSAVDNQRKGRTEFHLKFSQCPVSRLRKMSVASKVWHL